MPGRTLRAFLPGDPVIQSLTAELALNARITSIFPTFDSHIPEGSRLEGAHNVEVDTIGHFRILGAPETLAAVVEAVEGTAPVE
jgi:triacylglycerol lipase